MVMGVVPYNVQPLWVESVTFSEMTNTQGDEIYLLLAVAVVFKQLL